MGTEGGDDRLVLFRGKGWFWLPLVPLILADLWTKSAAFSFLAEQFPYRVDEHREYPVWEGPVRFSLVSWLNTGTVWGLGQDFNWALRVLRCGALVVLTWFAARTPAGRRAQLLVLAMITAGAVGNLYDNFTQPQGGVRDFLLFFVGEGADRVAWPAFNVADACICVGAVGLGILLWRADDPKGGSAEKA